MIYQAKVYVTLKEGVLDTQGSAVRQGLVSLGYPVEDVRVGRYIVLSVEADSREAALASVQEMCHRLLANPVIEDYAFELEEEA